MRLKNIFPAVAVLLLFSLKISAQNTISRKLWYNKPALAWTEALPLGNGKLGAMVFGGVEKDVVQLNESTLWSGGPVKENVNPASVSFLPQIREALLAKNDFTKANILSRKMQGYYTQSYLPMGEITISQDFKGRGYKDYRRELDLSTATVETSYTSGGVKFVKKSFISAPDNVMVIHLTSNKKGAIALNIGTRSLLKATVKGQGGTELLVSGKAPSNVDPSYYNPKGRRPVIYADSSGCSGMRFQFRVRAVCTDGKTVIKGDSVLQIKKASEVVLYIAGATSFNGFNRCPESKGKDESLIASNIISRSVQRGFKKIYQGHIADYTKYFSRVNLQLNDTSLRNANAVLPTDIRLKNYTHGAYDPKFESLYFDFGRYLLISSSRPGGPPANLQGIWNNELRAPWSSNYTININTQMNYWPAETTNLSEMHQPLLDWIKSLSITGKETARGFYGARGWTAHHNSDIWALSNPVGDFGAGDPSWANWGMSGDWLSRHLFEHYQFTGDKKFLKEYAYPIMKGAAEFSLDWLVDDGTGHLVTAPSTSPENKFFDASGRQQSVCFGSTMDMSIIRDLFRNILKTCEILNIDKAFADTVRNTYNRLHPLQLGKDERILEWYKDYPETDLHHRHVSHLYGLYPASEITPQIDSFYNGAKKTLEKRGDEGTGWSKAWKVNWWARLQDGDHAYKLLRDLLHYTDASKIGGVVGGTYANLFDAHPPFQIDGNFALTAGIAEMLVQSHQDFIQLLPALPQAWKSGPVSGLKARGAFELNILWNAHQLKSATFKSLKGNKCIIQSKIPLRLNSSGKVSAKIGDHYQISFDTVTGKIYQLIRL